MAYTVGKRSTPLTLRVTAELKDAIDRAAKDDRRTVANKIELIVTDWMRANGYLPKDLETSIEALSKAVHDHTLSIINSSTAPTSFTVKGEGATAPATHMSIREVTRSKLRAIAKKNMRALDLGDQDTTMHFNVGPSRKPKIEL